MSGSALASQIKAHMPVVGSDGGHVGTVDHMEEDRIKLTKQDDPSGRALHHHYLPVSAVDAVRGGEVRLNMDAAPCQRVGYHDRRLRADARHGERKRRLKLTACS